MKRLIYLILIAIIIGFFVRRYVIEMIYIASASMEPTLEIGTKLFVEKITYRFRTPTHNEIVVFPSPIDQNKELVKRVIGLPDDIIAIRNKIVYRNNKRLDEPYVKYTRKEETLLGDNVDSLKVPEGYIFVLGDNRDESNDSRDWKEPQTGEFIRFIAIDKIKGKIMR